MEILKPHCYSQRMLNPFHGVMNVIDTGDATCALLEGLACQQQALTVDAQQQLYPKIVNEEIIKVVRVEALMRKSNGEVSSHQKNIDMAYMAADFF